MQSGTCRKAKPAKYILVETLESTGDCTVFVVRDHKKKTEKGQEVTYSKFTLERFSFDRGEVTFSVYARNKDAGIERVKQHSCKQDEFVKLLQTGILTQNDESTGLRVTMDFFSEYKNVESE